MFQLPMTVHYDVPERKGLICYVEILFLGSTGPLKVVGSRNLTAASGLVKELANGVK